MTSWHLWVSTTTNWSITWPNVPRHHLPPAHPRCPLAARHRRHHPRLHEGVVDPRAVDEAEDAEGLHPAAMAMAVAVHPTVVVVVVGAAGDVDGGAGVGAAAEHPLDEHA